VDAPSFEQQDNAVTRNDTGHVYAIFSLGVLLFVPSDYSQGHVNARSDFIRATTMRMAACFLLNE